MNTKHIIGLLAIAILMMTCSDDDDQNIIKQRDDKEILTFTFLAEDNGSLSADIRAVINKEEMTISAKFPIGISLTALTPTITLSDKATINPESKKAMDFSNPVTYTVTAEDGSTDEYEAMFTVSKSDEKEILKFTFLADDNDDLSTDIEADIDEGENTIIAKLPANVFLRSLKPTIALSERATVDPESKQVINFSQPVVYTVTAEDGSTRDYNVILRKAPTAREVLLAINAANPGNTLGWDLDEPDISTWAGVVTDENDATKVIGLFLYQNNLTTIPPVIEELKDLKELSLRFTGLMNIPAEIGNLKNLTYLDLSLNELTSIPNEIGKLTNLKILDLLDNELTGIQKELIENLTNLETLYLQNNQITYLAPEIRNLSKLQRLYLAYNRLESIPAEVFDLATLDVLSIHHNSITYLPDGIEKLAGSLTVLNLNANKLKSIPPQTGQLQKLLQLLISSNQLEGLPRALGDLKALMGLNIEDNPNLTTIPKEICDLASTSSLEIFKDNTATCEQ